MQSAPANMPAMTVVSFPAGFTPAERTFVAAGSMRTRFSISSDNPARSASISAGASPANDTRLASSNSAAARDHTSGSFTASAFWYGTDSWTRHPRSSRARRHFQFITTPRTSANPKPVHGLRIRGGLGAPLVAVENQIDLRVTALHADTVDAAAVGQRPRPCGRHGRRVLLRPDV